MPNDTTTTNMLNQEEMLHNYLMENDEQYRNKVMQQEWLAKQDKPLEDRSLDMLALALPTKGISKFAQPNTEAQLATKLQLEDTRLYDELLKIGQENALAKQQGRAATNKAFMQQEAERQAAINEGSNLAKWNHSTLAQQIGEKYNENYAGNYRLLNETR